jgi:hypothetical protein
MICHSPYHPLAKTTQKSFRHPKASFFLFESCKFLSYLTTTLPIVATKTRKISIITDTPKCFPLAFSHPNLMFVLFILLPWLPCYFPQTSSCLQVMILPCLSQTLHIFFTPKHKRKRPLLALIGSSGFKVKMANLDPSSVKNLS